MFPELTGEISSRMMFNGKEVVVWSINNYLGLANHPEVRKTDAEAAKKWGLAYPMGARLMTGETAAQAIEPVSCAFYNKRPLVNFGYQVWCPPSMHCSAEEMRWSMMQKVMVVSSMVRLHIGERFAYKHNDIESVATTWSVRKMDGRKRWWYLVVTGVFSMRGDQGSRKK